MRLAALFFVPILIAVLSVNVYCQQKPDFSKMTADEISNYLIHENSGDISVLKSIPRAIALKALRELQSRKDGEKDLQLAYLLARLNYRYGFNRGLILKELRRISLRQTQGGIDDRCVEYAFELYQTGDRELIKPLLAAAPYSDGAVAEGLGFYYPKILLKNTQLFLTELSQLSPKHQRDVIMLTAYSDGGGMEQTEYKAVVRKLAPIANNNDDPFAEIARRLLKKIKQAGPLK